MLQLALFLILTVKTYFAQWIGSKWSNFIDFLNKKPLISLKIFHLNEN